MELGPDRTLTSDMRSDTICSQTRYQLRYVAQYVNLFENSIKPDLNSIENSVDPDQLASEEAIRSGSSLFSKQHASLK